MENLFILMESTTKAISKMIPFREKDHFSMEKIGLHTLETGFKISFMEKELFTTSTPHLFILPLTLKISTLLETVGSNTKVLIFELR